MNAKVNPGGRVPRQSHRGLLHFARGPRQGEHGAIVVAIGVDIEKPCTRRAYGTGNGGDDRRIASLAHVRDTLDQGACASSSQAGTSRSEASASASRAVSRDTVADAASCPSTVATTFA